MTLYELTEDMRTLLDMLEEENTEDEQEAIENALQEVLENLTDKAEGYGKVMKQLDADIEALDEEERRIRKKKAALKNNKDRMREAMKCAMLITGQKKIKTALFSFSVSTRLKAVLDVDVDRLPEDLVRVTKEPRMQEITQILKDDPTCGIAHFEPVDSLTVR